MSNSPPVPANFIYNNHIHPLYSPCYPNPYIHNPYNVYGNSTKIQRANFILRITSLLILHYITRTMICYILSRYKIIISTLIFIICIIIIASLGILLLADIQKRISSQKLFVLVFATIQTICISISSSFIFFDWGLLAAIFPGSIGLILVIYLPIIAFIRNHKKRKFLFLLVYAKISFLSIFLKIYKEGFKEEIIAILLIFIEIFFVIWDIHILKIKFRENIEEATFDSALKGISEYLYNSGIIITFLIKMVLHRIDNLSIERAKIKGNVNNVNPQI